MVRNYKKTGKKNDYTMEFKLAVINTYNTVAKQSCTATGRIHDINESTIRGWIAKPTQQPKVGRKPVLDEDEERHIVDICLILSESGLPMGREDIKTIVEQYCAKVNKPVHLRKVDLVKTGC